MKILTNAVATDTCDAGPGEICIPWSFVCTNPSKAAVCGCDRTHMGISSHAATTAVQVSETDWSFDDLVAVCRNHFTESNWTEVYGPDDLDELATHMVAQSVEVANDHETGTVLRPRFDHERELWFYDEVDE